MSTIKLNASGNVKALFVRDLLKGECDCFYDDKPEYYTENSKVYILISYIKYPNTFYDINNASRLQICKWYRFLPQPKNEAQKTILDRVISRFYEIGGYTVEISKEIGSGDRIIYESFYN